MGRRRRRNCMFRVQLYSYENERGNRTDIVSMDILADARVDWIKGRWREAAGVVQGI